MYRPEKFVEDRPHVLINAMRSIRLAAIVTPAAHGIEVTHVPTVVHGDGKDTSVVLETHVARANAHWKAAAEGAASVAIYQGPHAYVTPSWYPSKQEHGKVVPTWAYIVVHAHGRLTAVEDEEWLRCHLDELTVANEAAQPNPWQVTDAPEEFVGRLSRGIVGLRLTVGRLEGAWKLNQHKGAADREGTRTGLAGMGPMGAQLAEELASRNLADDG